MKPDDLASARSRDQLVALAEGAGVEVAASWSRARIAEAVLAAEVDPGPDDLGPAGAELWARVSSGVVLRPDERAVLAQAAKTADMIARLEDALDGQPTTVTGSTGQTVLHPLIAEVRQERLLLASLLGRVDVPEEGEENGNVWNGLTASQRARKAAHARWQR